MAGCFGSMTNTWKCDTSQSGYLIVLDSNNGNILNEIPLGGYYGQVVLISHLMEQVCYMPQMNKIALWDLKSNKPGLTLFTATAPDSNYYPDVAAAPDGLSLEAVYRRQSLCLGSCWQTASGKRRLIS